MYNKSNNELIALKVVNSNTRRKSNHIKYCKWFLENGFQCATWKVSWKWTLLTHYCILGLCAH